MGIENRGLTLRQITFVATRLISVYVLARTLFLLPQAAQVLFSGGLEVGGGVFAAGLLLTVILGVLLWTQAGWLARALVGEVENATPVGSVSVRELETIAFSLLGLSILVNSLPFLVTSIAELLAPNTFDRFFQEGSSDTFRAAKILETVGALGRVIISIWLLLGSRSFVTLLRRLRERARNVHVNGDDEVESSERE